MNIRTYIFFFLATFLLGMVSTPIMRALALRFGLVDRTGARKVHTTPIPRLGGMAIFFAFLIPFGGFLFYANMVRQAIVERLPELFTVLMGGLMVFMIGVYDDIRGTRARYKLIVQILAALLVYAAGVRVETLSNPFGTAPLHLGHLFGLPLTVIWIVGVTNAINLSDGIDGLAGGLSVIIGLTIFGLALIMGHPAEAIFAISIAGAAGGFLVHNFPPASIFMGDAGALFLGFMLACISILGSMKSTAAVALAVPILAMIVPIADTLMAMLRRGIRGQRISAPDKDHVHHRLLGMGLSNRQVIYILYTVTIVFGLIALTINSIEQPQKSIILALVGVLVIVLFRRLGYREIDIGAMPGTIVAGRARRKETSQEMEIIKDFTRAVPNLPGRTELWKLTIDTCRQLCYTAVEITPARGTSLFQKEVGGQRSEVGEDGPLGTPSAGSAPDPDGRAPRSAFSPIGPLTSDLGPLGPSKSPTGNTTDAEGLSFFWTDPDAELDAPNIKWYLEHKIQYRGRLICTLRVYKEDKGEHQKIHDEDMLLFMATAIGEGIGEGRI
ncbi:MAG: MraY family glycosyltransferase [Planctomycetota bacterium]